MTELNNQPFETMLDRANALLDRNALLEEFIRAWLSYEAEGSSLHRQAKHTDLKNRARKLGIKNE